MSSGSPWRGIGCPETNAVAIVSFDRAFAVAGVRVIPGRTAFTRTPSGPSSSAATCTRWSTAAFPAEYDAGVIDFSAYAPIRIPRGRPVGVNVNHLTAPTARERWGAAMGGLIAREERWLLGRARELSVISEWTGRTLAPLLRADAHIE